VDGNNAVRDMSKKTRTFMNVTLTGNRTFEEVLPGDQDLTQFVKREAWGHHASCTVPMGADGDPKAALDSHFRVRGVTALRVVDASVFPKIPGFFIVTPIYMVAEKATDTILADVFNEQRKK
jgi:choline dehydrogenase